VGQPKCAGCEKGREGSIPLDIGSSPLSQSNCGNTTPQLFGTIEHLPSASAEGLVFHVPNALDSVIPMVSANNLATGIGSNYTVPSVSVELWLSSFGVGPNSLPQWSPEWTLDKNVDFFFYFYRRYITSEHYMVFSDPWDIFSCCFPSLAMSHLGLKYALVAFSMLVYFKISDREAEGLPLARTFFNLASKNLLQLLQNYRFVGTDPLPSIAAWLHLTLFKVLPLFA
jgi:hypothetical protein